MNLREVMGIDFQQDQDSKAHKFDTVEVIWQQNIFAESLKPWPGKHKYVYFWVILENGYAVGMNENPSYGLSFPFVKYKS
jgi:hypothetical protein